MINLMRRNWKLYIRDRAAVLYSMLGVFIMIGLYVLFLGDNMVSFIGDMPDGRFLVDSWIMAGLVGVTTITTTLGALGTIVEDRDRKIDKDFRASPLKRWQISGGYMASAVLVGFFMSCVTLVLAEVYIVVKGGSLLPLGDLLKVLALILLSTITAVSLLFPLITSVKSTGSFGGISTVVGTLSGFITGMYIPIGEVGVAIQWVMKCFPMTHAVVLLRQVMTAVPRSTIFAGAPAAVEAEMSEYIGIVLRFGDTVLQPWMHVVVLLATTAIFFGLSVWLVSRSKASA